MKKYLFIAVMILSCLPAYGQRMRTISATSLPASGMAYPVADTITIAGTRVVYSRSFLIIGAEDIGVRTLARGLTDSINIILNWQISPGDSIFTDPDTPLVCDTSIVSGTGSDTSFVQPSTPPTYAYWARFRIEGRMPGTDSCKVSVVVTRFNRP